MIPFKANLPICYMCFSLRFAAALHSAGMSLLSISSALIQAICWPFGSLNMLLRPNMQVHEGDAAEYLMHVAAEVQQGRAEPLDMVFVDAFDGNDDVPVSLCSPGKMPATGSEFKPQQLHLLFDCFGVLDYTMFILSGCNALSSGCLCHALCLPCGQLVSGVSTTNVISTCEAYNSCMQTVLFWML